MKYKAIFFDRDGTLTYYVQEKINWRDSLIEEWSGKPFELPYDKMIMLFNKAKENRPYKYKNLEDEKEFFQRYYKYLLIEEGVTEKVEERAKLLFDTASNATHSFSVTRHALNKADVSISIALHPKFNISLI